MREIWYAYNKIVTDHVGCEIYCVNEVLAKELAYRLNNDNVWPKGILPDYVNDYIIAEDNWYSRSTYN